MRPTMRLVTGGLLALAVAGATACASGGGPRQERRNPRVITQAEIQATPMPTLHALVSTLRPQWFVPRGTDTLGQRGEIRVYMGSTRLNGGPSVLAEIPPMGVTRLEFIDPIAAAARWGLDHNQGAIVITTSQSGQAR